MVSSPIAFKLGEHAPKIILLFRAGGVLMY
jgi:hypothetical protein